MAKRLTDVVLAAVGLMLALPILAVAALGIRLSSRGPLLYRAQLAGRRGMLFTMYKLRTMHETRGLPGSAVTAARDPRVFAFGVFLRRCKIDELPQLVNVLRGDMSLVGPRPEHPELLHKQLTAAREETLTVQPGLTSPGTLFDYTHGEEILGCEAAEQRYFDILLPTKVALDIVYVRNASWLYDAQLILRTLWLIAAVAAGRRRFPLPREFSAARGLLHGPATPDDPPLALRLAEI